MNRKPKQYKEKQVVKGYIICTTDNKFVVTGSYTYIYHQHVAEMKNSEFNFIHFFNSKEKVKEFIEMLKNRNIDSHLYIRDYHYVKVKQTWNFFPTKKLFIKGNKNEK